MPRARAGRRRQRPAAVLMGHAASCRHSRSMSALESPSSEWTPGRGLRRAAMWLLIKSPVCLVVWTGFLIVTERSATWIGTHGGNIWIVFGTAVLVATVVAIPALPCGHLLGRRLPEHAGFDGPVPATLGISLVWVLVFLSAKAAALFTGPTTWVTGMAVVGIGVEASLVVLWRTWINPD